MNRFCVLAVCLLLNSACFAAPIISVEMDGRDLKFLTSVAENGVLLGSLGEIAQARAGSEPVKKLGEAIVANHAVAKLQVKRVAESKGVTVANAADAIQITRVDRLTKLQGPKFEKECMEEILLVYQKLLDDLQPGIKSSDSDIRALAEKLLPQLKQQFALAQKIAGVPPIPGTSPIFRGALPDR